MECLLTYLRVRKSPPVERKTAALINFRIVFRAQQRPNLYFSENIRIRLSNGSHSTWVMRTPFSASYRQRFLIGITRSRKTLVMQVDLPDLMILIVHLPVIRHDRRAQLCELAAAVYNCSKDIIVCGDFNIFNGMDELDTLIRSTDLRVAGEGVATYPAHRPRFCLDVFLYRFAAHKFAPRMYLLDSVASDHRPVVLEW